MSSGKSDPELLIDGRRVPILVQRHVRSRGYRLRYDVAREALRLTMPVRGPIRPALEWVSSQQPWVRRQLERAPGLVRLEPGADVPVEGVPCRIVWDPARPRTPELTAGTLALGGPEAAIGARLMRWLRQRALAVLTRETLDMAGRAGLTVASISIGDPRSRWGSCTVDGAIRYSWRLILAPPEVRRATVAHELAHRLHMDHSPAFHAAHARILGTDPRPARAWLRAHGAGLHRISA